MNIILGKILINVYFISTINDQCSHTRAPIDIKKPNGLPIVLICDGCEVI